MQINNTLIN